MQKYFSKLINSKITFCGLLLLLSFNLFAQDSASGFYKEPGLNPNRSFVNQSANEHIDPFTGALQRHYVDLHIPGNGGFDLDVVRSYNSTAVNISNPASNDSLAGLSGLGWSIHFGRVLGPYTATVCEQPKEDNEGGLISLPADLVLELPDGSKQTLKWNEARTSPLVTRWSAKRWIVVCNSTSVTGTLSVFSPNGIRYTMMPMFNKSEPESPVFLGWYTTSIIDRNNNWALINYNGASALPEITNIDTRDGRSVSFEYFDQGLINRRVKSISSAGQTYQYNYSGRIGGNSNKYFLTSVTRPDQTSWTYAYNDASLGYNGGFLMKGLINPQGGHTDYYYTKFTAETDTWNDTLINNTAVAKKISSDGGQWIFTYPTRNIGQLDTTIVDGPTGRTTYTHIGPNYATNGSLWTIGLLISKTIGSTQSETYAWDKRTISGQRVTRGTGIYAKSDNAFYTPILVQKNINRDGAVYATTYSGHDAYENVGAVTESGTYGGNRTTTFTYYTNPIKKILNQLANENYPGSYTHRSFDTNTGNLNSISRDGVATTYTHDSEGNISSANLPRGITHQYSNYKRGIAQTENQAEGVSISRAVDDAGNVTSETNGDGYTTYYDYDGLNRVKYIGYPVGNAVSISYGATLKVAQRGALQEVTNYDNFGRVIGITLGGIGRTFTVDALGRKTFESNPGAAIGTNYSYDILDRVISVNNSDGTSQSISYGAGTKAIVDEKGAVTAYAYRAYGNPDQQYPMSLTSQVDAANVTILRNGKDLITAVTQGGFARGYGYNANYYLTSVTNPETGTTTYGRDAAGNMTTRTIGASGTTTYAYDGQNRLTSVIYPGDTPAVTNTFNKTNRLLSSNSSVANRSYSYDANGNLKSDTLTIDSRNYTAGYTYNGNDQLSSIAYPNSGSVITYSPDVLGRPTQVSGYVTGVTYWPSGQINQINYANGTVTNYNQNSRLWPSSFSTQRAGSYLNNNSYAYDGVGNLMSIIDSVDSNYNRSLGYDSINRLISSNGPWGTGNIVYSGIGNINNQVFGSSSLSYAYDGNNRLSSISGAKTASYSYDSYGNIAADGSNNYTYDGVPNLRCINCANTAARTQYKYDAANHRVFSSTADAVTYDFIDSQGKLLFSHADRSSSGDMTEFFYLGGKRIAQKQEKYIKVANALGRLYNITSLKSEFSPAGLNQNVILVATIESGNSGGTVTFYDGNRVLGTAPVINNTATLNVSFSAIGNVTVTATYSGARRLTNTYSVSIPIVAEVQPTPVYRFRNSSTGAYLLTSSIAERDAILKLPTWALEGAALKAHTSNVVAGLSPVYRFRSDAGGYFYTISQSEKDSVIANIPSYHYEGIAWYAKSAQAGNALPLYRFYNTTNGTHFFTATEAEKNYVIANIPSWTYEGISQYVWAAGTGVAN